MSELHVRVSMSLVDKMHLIELCTIFNFKFDMLGVFFIVNLAFEVIIFDCQTEQYYNCVFVEGLGESDVSRYGTWNRNNEYEYERQ